LISTANQIPRVRSESPWTASNGGTAQHQVLKQSPWESENIPSVTLWFFSSFSPVPLLSPKLLFGSQNSWFKDRDEIFKFLKPLLSLPEPFELFSSLLVASRTSPKLENMLQHLSF
jgi:hypothetical protein